MSELTDAEVVTDEEAPQVPLGGQPIHPEPLSPAEITQQKQANASTVNDLFRRVQSVILEVEKELPVGVDEATRHLRSFVSYNKALLSTVVK